MFVLASPRRDQASGRTMVLSHTTIREGNHITEDQRWERTRERGPDVDPSGEIARGTDTEGMNFTVKTYVCAKSGSPLFRVTAFITHGQIPLHFVHLTA